MARNVVGARELKTRLGTYLQRVREGRTLVVTDRGEPIAELRPLTPVGSVEYINEYSMPRCPGELAGGWASGIVRHMSG